MRALLPLLLLAAAGRAGEREKACLGQARQVGDLLLARDEVAGSDIYSGKAGVALFLVDLHAATGERRYLDRALELLAAIPNDDAELGSGLYTGWAGVGHVYLNANRIAEAEACAARLGAPEATDIISGAAGTGIFLLNLHRRTGKRRWLREADHRGKYLVERAIRTDGRASWPVAPRSPRVYIGLSHGAAGIGYFLLHLHRATKERIYRELAEEAARFVAHCAVEDGPDGWKWTKMQPPRKQAYPVQWCHGSPGIGFFFLDLHRHLGGAEHGAALDRCIASTLREGRTARIGACQCHGTGGNAELLIEAYRASPRERAALLEAAHAWSRHMVEDGRVATKVQRWSYPPGYMLGMAGIGRFFLRLSDPEGVGMALMVEVPRGG